MTFDLAILCYILTIAIYVQTLDSCLRVHSQTDKQGIGESYECCK